MQKTTRFQASSQMGVSKAKKHPKKEKAEIQNVRKQKKLNKEEYLQLFETEYNVLRRNLPMKLHSTD